MLSVHKFAHKVPYSFALNLQHEIILRKLANSAEPDHLLILEHEPVITLGRRVHQSMESMLENKMQIPVMKSPRGGQVTYHGPGQITCYPIVDLRKHQEKLSLQLYVELLAQMMMEILFKSYEIENAFVDSSTERLGLWLPGNKKIGFIGIQAQKWIISHGFSLNLTPESLVGFKNIDPCGLAKQNIKITCAESESHVNPSFEQVANIAIEEFKSFFKY